MWRYWKWLGASLTALVVLALASTMPTSEAKKPSPKPPPEPPAPRVICFGQWTGNGWDPTALIRTMDANGDNTFTVLQGGTLVSTSASWSPDGQWLGCYEREGVGIPPYDNAFFRVRPDGTDEQMVVSYTEIDAYNVEHDKTSLYDLGGPFPFGSLGGAAWGPDGYMLINANVVYDYISQPSGELRHRVVGRMFKLNLQTGALQQFMDYPGSYSDGATGYWQPWGKIVLGSDRNALFSGDLFSLDPDDLEGNDLHQVTDLADWPKMYGAALNRAGTEMALTMDTPESPVGANTDLYLLCVVEDPYHPGHPIQLGDPILLRGDPACQENAVAWSPDDSQLLMNRSWPDGLKQIVVIDMTTEFPYSETILAQSRKSLHASDWSSVAPGP